MSATSSPRPKPKRVVRGAPRQGDPKDCRVQTRKPTVDYAAFTRIVRALGIRTWREFEQRRAELAPLGVPADPKAVYRGEWEGTAVFYAGGRFVDYDEFKRTMRIRGVRTQSEFFRRRAELAPLRIPSNPSQTYRREWEGFPAAFGGDQRLSRGRNRKVATLHEAKAYAQASGISSESEWQRGVRERRIPPEYPSNPWQWYKGKGWKGYADFWGRETCVAGSAPERALRGGLSVGWTLSRRRTISVPDRTQTWRPDVVLPEEQVIIEYDGYYWHRHRAGPDRAKTRSLNAAGWRVVRVREAPLDALDPSLDIVVPCDVDGVTLARLVSAHLARIVGKPDRLSPIEDSLIRARQASVFTSPDERVPSMDQTMAIAQSLGVRSAAAYRQMLRRGSFPLGTPANPHKTYAATWRSWGHFLGTGRVAPKRKAGLPFE